MYRKPYSKQCVWVSDVSLYFSHALSSWLRTGEAYSTESPCQNYKCLGQDCSTIYPVLVYSPTSCLLSCGLFLCHLLCVLANSIDTTGSKSMHVIMLDLFQRQRKEIHQFGYERAVYCYLSCPIEMTQNFSRWRLTDDRIDETLLTKKSIIKITTAWDNWPNRGEDKLWFQRVKREE